MAITIFIPIFAVYRKEAFPYFVALIHHSLVGDYLAGGNLQLLWPLTSQTYGTSISIGSPTNITVELVIFLISVTVMLKTKDILIFFQPHNSNLLLSIPTFTVLLPTFLSFPLGVPPALILPHIVYLILFLTSILMDIRQILILH